MNIYYSEEFYNICGKHAIMDPDSVQLGDIIDSKTCEVIGSLNDFGIEFTEKTKGKPNDNAEPIYKSKDITIGSVSAGQEGIANMKLHFGNDHSLYLATKGSKIVRIVEDNLGKNNLGKQIISLYTKEKWEDNWIVVTEVEYAKKAIIIVSDGENAEIELKAQSPIPSQSPIGIDKIINAEISFVSESSIGFRYIMPEGDYRSVLFKAKGIDESWRNGTQFVYKDYAKNGKPVKYLTDFMWKE